jgi:hypothetical protein
MSGNPTTTPNPGATASTLLNGGLTISSTSTAALNGTYNAGGLIMAAFQAQVNAVALDGTFADGTTTLEWPDKIGAPHAFSVAEFKSFAGALANFISLCTLYGMGIIQTAPSNTVTIP